MVGHEAQRLSAAHGEPGHGAPRRVASHAIARFDHARDFLPEVLAFARVRRPWRRRPAGGRRGAGDAARGSPGRPVNWPYGMVTTTGRMAPVPINVSSTTAARPS